MVTDGDTDTLLRDALVVLDEVERFRIVGPQAVDAYAEAGRHRSIMRSDHVRICKPLLLKGNSHE
jgi:hypothetical protein